MNRLLAFLLVLPCLCSLAACTAPPALAPVVANQGALQARLAGSYAVDLGLLRSLASSNLAAQRAILVGDIEREIIRTDWIDYSKGTFSAPKFAADLATPDKINAVLEDVRAGRLGEDRAMTWLSDYAGVERLSDPRGRRAAMIASLGRVVTFDRASSDLLGAIDAHSARVGKLFGELGLDNAAIAGFADNSQLQNALDIRQFGLDAIAGFIPDPTRAAQATDLFSSLFKFASPGTIGK